MSELAAIVAAVEARGVKAGVLIHAVRVALAGKTVSPGLFDVLSLLGRERVHARILDGLERRLEPGAQVLVLLGEAQALAQVRFRFVDDLP